MRTTLLIIAVTLFGCDAVESDARPAFVLDASKPFIIELGRGSGWHGLDIIKVNETGAVELYRTAGDRNVESASLRLSSADVSKLVGMVNAHHLMSLDRAYSDPNIADGMQWVLWIEQFPSEKSVYFNNSFPHQITGFANGLDALLQSTGESTVTWSPVPKQQGIDQEATLWARIQPARSPNGGSEMKSGDEGRIDAYR